MQEYYFLYAIALIWIVFATVQDIRSREVSNWLNFSLIAIVLGYRAFYASFAKQPMFFVYGILGVLLFIVLGYVFYYSRVFAGGDAKLLMGLGGIWPYQLISDYLTLGLGFVFLLFAAGAIYTLVYSLFLINKRWDKFKKEFNSELKKKMGWLYFAVLLFFVIEIIIFVLGIHGSLNFVLVFIILLPLLYVYTKAIEDSCMIKLKKPAELTIGDWIVKDVRVRNRVIRKTTYGLTEKDIRDIKKTKKNVWIKDGVPFTPAFLIAFIIMVVLLRNFFF